jgi:cytochrome P450
MKLNGFFYGDKLRLEKFQDLHKIVLETLRMYPAEMMTRSVAKSFHFDGREFPVGTLIESQFVPVEETV